MNQTEPKAVGTMTCRELASEERELARRWREYVDSDTASGPYPHHRDAEVTLEIVRRVRVGTWESCECAEILRSETAKAPRGWREIEGGAP